jgi:nitronate monooxygenase
MKSDNLFLKHSGASVPLICGAMYPCSNPELIAAVAAAGALPIVQPVSMEFVYKKKLAEGIQWIRSRTQNPIGLNLLIEGSSKIYLERNRGWLKSGLENGVRFFVTALGNPKWVVDEVHAAGGVVYHDVTARKWAEKAIAAGVDGLICVNNRAGGHAGNLSPQDLAKSLADLNVPLVCAGGIGDSKDFAAALQQGYQGCQLGTRFIATTECAAHQDYKNAILKAEADDIVLTEKITGVPVAVIKTPYVEKMGWKSGPIEKFFLRNKRTKHYLRMLYSLRSVWQFKRSLQEGNSYKEYYQAGKSVHAVESILGAGQIVADFRKEWEAQA